MDVNEFARRVALDNRWLAVIQAQLREIPAFYTIATVHSEPALRPGNQPGVVLSEWVGDEASLDPKVRVACLSITELLADATMSAHGYTLSDGRLDAIGLPMPVTGIVASQAGLAVTCAGPVSGGSVRHLQRVVNALRGHLADKYLTVGMARY